MRLKFSGIYDVFQMSVTEEEKAFAHAELSWKIQQLVVLNLEKICSLFLFILIAYAHMLSLQASLQECSAA